MIPFDFEIEQQEEERIEALRIEVEQIEDERLKEERLTAMLESDDFDTVLAAMSVVMDRE